MRYHYVKPSIYLSKYGETYTCDHPVTVRKIMWALKMKPLNKNRWETCFDRRTI